MQCDNRAGGVGISIHALHEESDRHSMARFAVKSPFQSTLSMRRATHEFIYLRRTDVISIHALHEESDYSHKTIPPNTKRFQSTLSMRRATIT